jgi:hypothetical protein
MFSLVLVTGLSGKQDALESYLLHRFAKGANVRVKVFKTIDMPAEDVVPCAPNLHDSALDLLQVLQAVRHEKTEISNPEGLAIMSTPVKVSSSCHSLRRGRRDSPHSTCVVSWSSPGTNPCESSHISYMGRAPRVHHMHGMYSVVLIQGN